MHGYTGVTTRFLNPAERQVLSEETEMPLVIEPEHDASSSFLKAFLISHSEQILNDIAQYGAVLLRGFNVTTESDFEQSVLSIRTMRGISEAFMSEQGRVHVGDSKYVLHTNAVYKTGGTLYLGGFHSENYYSPDVPTYISFCCLEPSTTGGETGLINMEKVYPHLSDETKFKLENNTCFVDKWAFSDIIERYQIDEEKIEEICNYFNLPVTRIENEKYVLMYKPNVFQHPITGKKSPQINYFELPTLNSKLRKLFIEDYPGKQWFWHRFIWRIHDALLKIPETIYMIFASLSHSPKESFAIIKKKINNFIVDNTFPKPFYDGRVNQCFTKKDVDTLAKAMHAHYCSCLWKKGDILIVDNRKVVHAGMPGTGDRTIRAMICNPLKMRYYYGETGLTYCDEREMETIGYYMAYGEKEEDKTITEKPEVETTF